MSQFLHQRYFHNSLENWLWFLGIIIIGFILKRLISVLLSKLIYRLLKKDSAGVPIGEFLRLLRQPIEFLLTLGIFYIALDQLHIPRHLRFIPLQNIRLSVLIHRVLDTFFIIACTWTVTRIIKFVALILKKKAIETSSKLDDQLVPFFRDIIIAATVFISFFLILGFIFKQDVASLITGLGIGGVALALAARETLENLFASFTLILDRPFIVGDDVEVGAIVGTVEKVGFRSTRLRAVDGSLITMPNRLMVSQALNNTTNRKYRRVKHYLKLQPNMSIEKIQAISEEIKYELSLNDLTNIEKPMIQFDNFGEYSLDLLLVYYISTSDWRLFNQTKENINFALKEILEKHQVILALPTQQFVSIS